MGTAGLESPTFEVHPLAEIEAALAEASQPEEVGA